MGIITVPGETFKHINEEDLSKGLILILIISLLSAWAGATYFSKTEIELRVRGGQGFFGGDGSTSTPDLKEIKAQMTPLVATVNAVTIFTRWLIPSILLLISAKILVDRGSTKRHFAVTAFASVPLLFQQILRVIDSHIITPVELNQLVATTQPGTGFMDKLLYQGLSVLNFFGFITLVLTIFAIKENYETTSRKSSQVVLLAYVGYILIRILLPIL